MGQRLLRPIPAFLGSLCRNPSQVGCIAPSSPALARRIASLVDPESPLVLEMGAGTGAVTKALLQRGVPAARLHALELDPHLTAYLRGEFPDIHVWCGNAERLTELLPSAMVGQVSSIVSSLPLRNMRPHVRIGIIRAAMRALAPGGQLIQFTYRLRCPVPRGIAEMTSERIECIWSNLPPATVWQFRKAA